MVLKYNNKISIEKFTDLNEISRISLKYIKEGNIALSGGSTYLKLLKKWAEEDLDLENVNFYPVDERVVDFDSEYSNWGNSYRNFLSKYNKNRENHFTDSERYNNALQDIKMNTIFLGVGDDGHTASLFSTESVFRDKNIYAISSISPKEPKKRISLTGEYIIKAKKIIIIFYGEGKEKIVDKVIKGEKLPITELLKRVKKGVIYIHSPLLQE